MATVLRKREKKKSGVAVYLIFVTIQWWMVMRFVSAL